VIRRRLPGKGGLIALDSAGGIALPFNTEGMYRGWIDRSGLAHTAIYADVKQWNS
jgi:L-asparaginase / beta-aspartyl-peptidase